MKAGWQTKKLSSVCEMFADGDWIESKDQSLEGIRLIQTGNVGNGVFKDRVEKARYISEQTFKRLRCTEIFEGDCLISRLPDPAGRACIIPNTGERMITAVDCTIVRFCPDMIIESFFNYYAQSQKYLRDVNSQATGATRKRISRSNLGEILIPLPSLPEQQRIVAILDEAFADIATTTANAKKNLNNARELFASYLQNIRAEKQPLNDFVSIKTGKLDVNAFKEGGEYPFFTCSRKVYAIDTFAFDCEAILLAGNNASGDFNVKHYNGKFNAYQRTYVITVNQENKLLYRYLYFQMVNSLREFKNKSVGANTKFLKLGMIKDLRIPLPDFEEQQAIVAKLDELSAETKKLEAIYQQKLTALEELKKAILQQAFAGEL